VGHKFSLWQPRAEKIPKDYEELAGIIHGNRGFKGIERLEYGDHGLEKTIHAVADAIKLGKRIALYADYDVDGTMSCVSWIWFLQALNFNNFEYYIPDRMREGYGVNMQAVKFLVEEKHAQLIITMDTGITANEEAAYCKSKGVEFICTDHHKIQTEKMPDCIILNPKMHPHEDYQELCGCGITFVLLRKLAQFFTVPASLWTDLLALAGMATICDVVPLNSVNHRLAKLGVEAFMQSKRLVFQKLREETAMHTKADEKDVGFRIGPRINAVGRLEHARSVVEAFVNNDPDLLVKNMSECNDRRKQIQQEIFKEADILAKEHVKDPLLFLGGDWHPGVVGIVASKIAEKYWKPTWLFQRGEETCKGSARTIPGFDVTEAMAQAGPLWLKFGGHVAAGGFSFSRANEAALRNALVGAARIRLQTEPEIWQSRAFYDCELPLDLAGLELAASLQSLKPFGHGFEEPRFMVHAEIEQVNFYQDKVTGEPRHTAVFLRSGRGSQKVMFFNEVHMNLKAAKTASFLVTAEKNVFRGVSSLSLMGHDFEISG
jgi:single-stranded-DNA-specific exonuclease